MQPLSSQLKSHQQGFTLIEIIAVVFIIGIIVSFAVLSVADRAQDDRLENEARRLEQIMRLASDEAILLGIELGMRSNGRNYGFVVIGEEGAWVPYLTDGPLRERSLPEGMELELVTEEFEPPPAEDAEFLPQLLFFSSGELSPFRLRLSGTGATRAWRINGDLLGKIELLPIDKDEAL